MKFIVLMMLPLVLFSCKDEAQVMRPSTGPSPLETVRKLAEENKRFAEAKQVEGVPYSPEFKAIHERGHIIFAMVSYDAKPFLYNDEQTGELVGLDVEMGYAIANLLGVKAVFNREATTFNGVVMKVAGGEADIGLSCLSITTQRAEMVRFTKPYIVLRQTLLINRLEFAKIGPEELLPEFIKNYSGTIGVEGGGSNMEYVKTNFPKADVRLFDSYNQALEALLKGEVLASFQDENRLLLAIKTINDASILLKQVFISDKLDPIAMVVSANAPLLQNWLNIFIDDYLLHNKQNMTINRLIERHL